MAYSGISFCLDFCKGLGKIGLADLRYQLRDLLVVCLKWRNESARFSGTRLGYSHFRNINKLIQYTIGVDGL